MMNVFRWRTPGQRDSLYRVWLKSFVYLMALFFALFIIFTTAIVFTRLDRNIAILLERAQSISWLEYNRFFDTSTNSLTVLANELETGVVRDHKALATVLDGRPAVDIWFVTDQAGRVLLSNASDGVPILPQLMAAAQSAWQSGDNVAASEIVSLDQLRTFSAPLAERAVIAGEDASEGGYGALFQVVAVPYRNQNRQLSGVMVAAHLLNNDPSMAQRVRNQIPDSFSTISVNGLRIAGNLEIPGTPPYYGIGRRQADDLTNAISQGERYEGRVSLADGLVHLVVSDPIRNAAGQVIGAVTTGHPSQGLATLKRDTMLYMVLSAVVCLIAVVIASTLASKRLAEPIVRLARAAKFLHEAEGISQEHVNMFHDLPPARTREVYALQLYVTRATKSLYEKNQQILGYLNEIEVERYKLQLLADQLQEANETLEARVEEKTLELRNAMLDLVESNKLKSKFLANTSHELRTPLNSIIGFSDTLASGIYGELTEQQCKRVRIIGESARYLLQLINDLLDMSLIEQDKLSLERQRVDLHELIPSVLSIIRHDCDQKQIEISAQLDENLPKVYVDPTRIKQVLYNVLSNSVKFTVGGGQILVRACVGPGEVIVTVQDTGIGISESDQFHVFDEFYQAENGGARKGGGFGLGLPLSKKLVEAHGGRIELKSILGEGTTVTIQLPIDS